ncbi:MltA domain-containing protein [Acetobacteraceae bacterium KSS8]|uniref:peptidoglycan lytic exotransglycosylase n=1 Tax=Endosaccharibacter trunci TaxID=2812733 RepID=A0ABT1W7A9_9PROT|nr:MltA domain-containing protein [Acetobacteraceae bacterium KSS8]
MLFSSRPAALAAALLSALLMQGCAEQSSAPSLSLTRVSYDEVPGWNTDPMRDVLSPLLAECRRLGRLPADTKLGGAAEAEQQGGLAGQYRAACQAAAALRSDDPQTLHRYFETWFLPYAVSNGGDAEARFTGYFEPEFAGNLGESAAFPVPVYARPRELVTVPSPTPGAPPVTGQVRGGKVEPYWSRAQIDAGKLAHRNLEILWLRSPVDLFFMQIQGSGRVRLPSGQIVRVAYAGNNGQPYVPIGRELVAEGQLAPDAVSMQSIRAWLASHPQQAQAEMERNPNYVFFRTLDDVAPNQGPPGSLGVPLSAARSMAVDRAFLPLGAPVFVSTTLPDGRPIQRLFLAQDTGTDITGPARGDLFVGWGDTAGRIAGALHAGGQMVILLPRQPARP